jgi:hypothetical protein
MACWPNTLDCEPESYEYKQCSGVLKNLQDQCKASDNILICRGTKTLEYDLALDNHYSSVLVTSACAHEQALRNYLAKPSDAHPELEELIDSETTQRLEAEGDLHKRRCARFATYYLLCAESAKGEHAFDLERALRDNLNGPPEKHQTFTVPAHIADAIKWACGMDTTGGKL